MVLEIEDWRMENRERRGNKEEGSYMTGLGFFYLRFSVQFGFDE